MFLISEQKQIVSPTPRLSCAWERTMNCGSSTNASSWAPRRLWFENGDCKILDNRVVDSHNALQPILRVRLALKNKTVLWFEVVRSSCHVRVSAPPWWRLDGRKPRRCRHHFRFLFPTVQEGTGIRGSGPCLCFNPCKVFFFSRNFLRI